MKSVIKYYLLISLFVPQCGQAQAVFKQQFGAWMVFHEKLSFKEICFAVSEPVAKSTGDQYRSPPYIVFTKIAKNNYEFMAYSGYKYSEVPVKLVIDDFYHFKLSPLEIEAWPYNELSDKEILKYAPKGKFMVVSSINSKKQEIIDKYSLNGLFRALNYIEETCK